MTIEINIDKSLAEWLINHQKRIMLSDEEMFEQMIRWVTEDFVGNDNKVKDSLLWTNSLVFLPTDYIEVSVTIIASQFDIVEGIANQIGSNVPATIEKMLYAYKKINDELYSHHKKMTDDEALCWFFGPTYKVVLADAKKEIKKREKYQAVGNVFRFPSQIAENRS